MSFTLRFRKENPVFYISIEKTERTDDPNCRDTNKACAYWAQNGFCESRRDFMLTDCRRSCNACETGIELLKYFVKVVSI